MMKLVMFSCNSYLSSFREVTSNDLSMLIASLASKSRDLDPIRGNVMKECLDILLPTITTIVHLSLRTGEMPSQLN